MMSTRKSFRFFLVFVTLAATNFPSSILFAQDEPTTRSLSPINAAAAKQIIVNQVDTSKFPKVSIFLTVLDQGSPVLNLSAADFKVREDEVLQEPLTVEPKLDPLSVVVTLDTSGSIKAALPKAQEAAGAFIDALGADDAVSVVGFAREVKPLSAFSANKAAAKTAIAGTVARGDTALYDALYTSVEMLKVRPGRKAVVLLSDGVDDDGSGKALSRHAVDEALKLAKEVNVPIFTIGLGEQIDKPLLDRLAKETGSISYQAPTADELHTLYEGIGKQLSGQYHLSYTSNLPGDGSVHRIRLDHAGMSSVKEYLSPSVGEKKIVLTAPTALPVAAEPVTVAASTGPSLPTPIQGGVNAESATLLEPGKLYRPSKKEPGWYRVNANVGDYLLLYAQCETNAHGDRNVKFFFQDKTEANSEYLTDWETVNYYRLIGAGSSQSFYMLIPHEAMVFGAYLTPVADHGAKGDAGESEGEAVEIALGAPSTGYIAYNGDRADMLKFQVTAGKYQIKVRPSAGLGARITAIDGDGVELGQTNSPNEGALAQLKVDVASDGLLYVRVSTAVYDAPGRLHPYTIVVGKDAATSPPQPSNNEILRAPESRQGS